MSFRWLILLVLGLPMQSLHAQPTTTPAETVPATQAQPIVAAPSQEEQLRTLLDTIREVENDRADLNRQLKRTPAPAEAQRLNEQAAQVTNRLKELQASFEEIATGGSSSTELQQKTEAAFNWQQEIEDVIRPLLDELKRLT